MMRFYDVTAGQILVDGVDLRMQNLNALRRHFAVVLQDPFLFTGTWPKTSASATKKSPRPRSSRPHATSTCSTSSRPCPTASMSRTGARQLALHRPEAAHQLRPRPGL
jgi:ABC-type transport system involved in Fe-S cluster assembly fused permease/ATPase subunit